MRKKQKLSTGIAAVVAISLACNSSGLLITETPQQPLQTPPPPEGQPGSISEIVIYSDPDIPLISHYEFVTSDENIIESVDLLGSKDDGDVTVEGAQLRFVGDSRPWTLQFDEMVRVIDVQTPDGAAYRIEFESGTTAKVEFLDENGQTGTEYVELGEDEKALLDIIRSSAGTSQRSHAVFSAAFELEPAYRDESDPPPPQYEWVKTASQTFSLSFAIDGDWISPSGINVELQGCEGVACLSSKVDYWPDGVTLKTVHEGAVPVDENPPAALTKACEEKRSWERLGVGVIGLGATIVGVLTLNPLITISGATVVSIALGSASIASETVGYKSCTEVVQWEVAKREFRALTSNVKICVAHPHIEFASPCTTILTHPFPVGQSEFGDYLVFERPRDWSVTFDGTCISTADSSELSPCYEDDDSSGGEGAGGDTTTDGESGIPKMVVVGSSFEEFGPDMDPPVIFQTTLDMTADFESATVTGTLVGEAERSFDWPCVNPNVDGDLWEANRLFFVEPYDTKFEGDLKPDGTFSAFIEPEGKTIAFLDHPFTEEGCLEMNDSLSIYNSPWKNNGEGFIRGSISRDGIVDISTHWTLGDTAGGGWEMNGNWNGGGTVIPEP